jgi:hypothetical protein
VDNTARRFAVKLIACLLLAALGLAGCSVANRMGMRSASAPTYLVLGGKLYVGETQGFADRRASVSLRTDEGEGTPPQTCAGTLAFTAERAGVVDLSCSNGSHARLAFEATDRTVGHAYATESEAATLTYGLEPEQAAAYLRAPAGKKLAIAPEGLKLEPAQP